LIRGIKVAPRAKRQIRAEAKWWTENRQSASDAFAREMETTFSLIAELPYVGERVPHPDISSLRRILLGVTQHHLYYSVNADSTEVEVLALWHTSRGKKPVL
jgi:plasmid stabilization system protein ParE